VLATIAFSLHHTDVLHSGIQMETCKMHQTIENINPTLNGQK